MKDKTLYYYLQKGLQNMTRSDRSSSCNGTRPTAGLYRNCARNMTRTKRRNSCIYGGLIVAVCRLETVLRRTEEIRKKVLDLQITCPEKRGETWIALSDEIRIFFGRPTSYLCRISVGNMTRANWWNSCTGVRSAKYVPRKWALNMIYCKQRNSCIYGQSTS